MNNQYDFTALNMLGVSGYEMAIAVINSSYYDKETDEMALNANLGVLKAMKENYRELVGPNEKTDERVKDYMQTLYFLINKARSIKPLEN